MPATATPLQTLVNRLTGLVRSARRLHTVRAVLLSTRDREQALLACQEAALAAGANLYHFTPIARRRFQPAQQAWERLGDGTHELPVLFGQALTTAGGGVFLCEDSMSVMQDPGGGRAARLALGDALALPRHEGGAVFVFIEPPGFEARLPQTIADQVVKLDLPLPRSDELAAMARTETIAVSHQLGQPIEVARAQAAAPQLADCLVGSTRKAARDSLRDVLTAHPTDLEGAASLLAEQKVGRLARELAMNVLDARETELPVGLDNLLEFVRIHRSRMRITGRTRARGILLIGPPGTGKTMLAKAIGREVDLPVVEFRISSLMNSLLGETERRFADAFATLEAMAPNVVFIDEIEKAFGDSSERDGGTMMRTTGALLTWLSENPYPNFIVATSNNLSRMGEIGLTMTRSERFDAAFFVNVPSAPARERILTRCLAAHGDAAAAMARQLAEESERFSGADLFALVKQSAARAEYLQRPLDLAFLRAEVARKRPRVLALYDEFAPLRRWGAVHCEPAAASD